MGSLEGQQEKDDTDVEKTLQGYRDFLAKTLLEVDTHLSLENTIVLPIHIDESQVLHSVDFLCPDCGATLIDFRGRADTHFKIVDINGKGFCHICQKSTPRRIRFYPDGHIQVCENGNWETHHPLDLDSLPLLARLIYKIKLFFFNIKSKFTSNE